MWRFGGRGWFCGMRRAGGGCVSQVVGALVKRFGSVRGKVKGEKKGSMRGRKGKHTPNPVTKTCTSLSAVRGRS